MRRKAYIPQETFEAGDIKRNRIPAALAYLLFFIPLLVCPESRYGRFHANQGLMLLFTGSVGAGVDLFLSYALKSAPPHAYLMIGVISLYVVFFMIGFFVVGMVSAYQGKAKRLPLFGKYTIIKNI